MTDDEKAEVREWFEGCKSYYDDCEESFNALVLDCAAELALDESEVYDYLEKLLEEEE